ncbi:ABC transporter substrate-binding protein [Massilia putida]|uniref:ABC transporter substrate-binding protein n=1 Tax=Massilia putida TaxID=1141883 RepID=UPI0009515E71|nr:ABC transporter substrate-binding protein [Massilia putida]
MKKLHQLAGTFAMSMCAVANAADTVRVAAVLELSGASSVSGINFKRGVDLAVEQINAQGGVLGKQIDLATLNTGSDVQAAARLATQAVNQKAVAVFGPATSDSVLASMAVIQQAHIVHFIGAEAAAITAQANPYIFRTSFTQATTMPKVASYISRIAKSKSLSIIYADNGFGRGGNALIKEALGRTRTAIVADVAAQPGQADFSVPVRAAIAANPDAIFVYTNENEAAGILVELHRQGWRKPIIGETVLASQKVIDTVGHAADGVIAHVGLTAAAPAAPVQSYRVSYEARYHDVPDHSAMKGYSGVYLWKAAVERAGRFDSSAVAQALHTTKFKTSEYPGVLADVEYDDKGDLNRESYVVEVKNGMQEVVVLLEKAE